jgi:hypothetical protein
MGSVSHIAGAAKRGKRVVQHETEISKAAELLIAQHGEDAGTIAARRADDMFREGNAAEGARWLEIFRKVALVTPSPKP